MESWFWYAATTQDDNSNISLVAHEDMVIALGERGGTSAAVRVGGRKDTTEENVVWTGRHRGRIATPVVYEGKMFWVSSGIANCVDVATGESVYQERLGSGGGGGSRGRGMAGDYASPVAGDGKIYVTLRDGTVHVIAAGEKLEVLATNKFESDTSNFSATPAIANGQLFMRSNEYLYCVGEMN